MEKISREIVAQPSTHRDLQTQSPAVDRQKVAFKLGGSEETDLDSSDVETKDTDVASENGLIFLSFESYLCGFSVCTHTDQPVFLDHCSLPSFM